MRRSSTDHTSTQFRRTIRKAEGIASRYGAHPITQEHIEEIATYYVDLSTLARQMMTKLYQPGETEKHFGHVLLEKEEAIQEFTDEDGDFDIETYREYTDVLKEQERKYVDSGIGK